MKSRHYAQAALGFVLAIPLLIWASRAVGTGPSIPQAVVDRSQESTRIEGSLHIGLRDANSVTLVTAANDWYHLDLGRCSDLAEQSKELDGREVCVRGKAFRTQTRAGKIAGLITVLDWTVLVPRLKGGEVHGLVYVNADAREQGPVLKANEPTPTPGEMESKESPGIDANPTAQPVAAAERPSEPADEAAAKEAGSLRRQIAVRADTFIRTHTSRSGLVLPNFVDLNFPIGVPDVRLRRQIFVPDITVYLRNIATGATSPEVSTDVRGRFAIPRMPAGTYLLCWKADGYFPGCAHEKIVIKDKTVFPQPVAIQPRFGVLFGKVVLANSEPAFRQDAALGVDAQTHVSLLDAMGKTLTRVRANRWGHYLIPAVSAAPVRVKAECQTAAAERAINFATGARIVDLTFNNRPPRIRAAYVLKNGKGIRLANADDTVQVRVEAEDPDGDALSYSWLPTAVKGGLAAFASPNADTVNWDLGSGTSQHTMYVLVSDNKGGFAQAKVDLSTSEKGVLFTGTVVGSDTPVVPDARVSINGVTTTTNAAGYFSISLPAEADRYVINVKKLGYQLLSKVTSEPVIGGQYRLVRAQKFVVDPKQPLIQIVERDDDKQRRRPGAVVQIPGNSLVDGAGNPPAGLVDIYLSSFDLLDPGTGLPGDFGAVNADGDVVTLTSYGAVQVDITDAAGTDFQLAPGREATVGIGIEQAQRLNPTPPPDKIELWTYDETKGLWIEDGLAERVGNYYVAKVKHFSPINVDVQKQDAACMRVVSDTNRLTLPFNIRITIPTGTGVDKVVDRTVTDPLTAIYRLPPNETIKIEVLDSEDHTIFFVEEDSGPSIPGQAVAPTYPYTECGSEAVLTFDAPPDFGFLDFIGTDNDAIATAYYDAVYPTGVAQNLDAWKAARGYTGGDAASAVYFNDGDLGFGRSMHMQASGNVISYYVTNYDTVDEARLDINAIATVAMEYSPPPSNPSGTPYIKFFVFADLDSDGVQELVNSADLDGGGQKFAPALCIICHGGNRPAFDGTGPYPNEGNVGAQFIGFDLESYKYSDFEFPPFSGTKPFGRAEQEDEFKLLNEAILSIQDQDTTYVKPALKELIAGWYGSAPDASGLVSLPLPSGTQNSGFVPGGWLSPTDKSGVYNNAVKRYCRACHTTRDATLDWATFDLMNSYDGFIKTIVCNLRVMPQARRTYLNFWLSTSPHGPSVFANGGINGWTPTDPCPEEP